MKESTFDKTEGFYDCISSNLPPRAMRYSMENKNNLKERGSIYVGLGTERNTTINVGTIDTTGANGAIQTEVIPQEFRMSETGVIRPPISSGTYVLVCKVGNDGKVEEMGWVKAPSFSSASIMSGSGIEDVNNYRNIND